MKLKNRKFKLISALVSTGAIASLATIAVTSCASNQEAKKVDNNLQDDINGPTNAAYVTLTFDANGGTLTGSKTIKMRSGKPFGSITPPIATKTDATFIGWFDSATGGQIIKPEDKIDSSKTIYAQYDAVIGVKTLTFNAGETGATLKGPTQVTIHEGETFASVARPDVFLADRDFKCWHYGDDDMEIETDFDYDDFSSTEQNTITPVFEDPKAEYVEIKTDEYSSNDEIALQYSSTLTAVVKGQTGVPQTVTWSSSDATTLEVSAAGVLTPKKEGEATITATSTDGLAVGTKTIKVVRPYQKYKNQIYAVDETTDPYTYWIADQGSLCTDDELTQIALTKAGAEATPQAIDRNQFDMSIYVGEEITSIGNYFLYGCSAFGTKTSTSVVIPDLNRASNLTFIGDCFMAECTAWKNNIVLPFSLRYIGNDFMSNCTSVTEATMPTDLLYVGESFMVNCYKLQTLTINCSADVFADALHIDTLSVDDPNTDAYKNGVAVQGNGAVAFKDKFREVSLAAQLVYRNYAE